MWYLPGQGSLMSLPSWCHHPHFDFTSPLICFPCPWTSHKSYKHICLFVSRWFCLSKIQPGGSPRVASVESTPNLPVHNPWGKAPVLTFSYTCPHPSSGKERSSRESWALKATDDQGSQASRFPYLDKEHQLPWGSHKSFYHWEILPRHVCSGRRSIFTTSVTSRMCLRTHPRIENSLAESREEKQDLLLM